MKLCLPDRAGVHLDTPPVSGRPLQGRAICSLKQAPESSGRTGGLAALWREVHREDRAMCERLQQGRASDAAAAGVLSPIWEDSVRNFRNLASERLR